MSETVVIELRVSSELFEWLGNRARRVGFSSAADYASALLEKAVFVMQETDKGADEDSLTDEEGLIAARLRALGYID